MEATRRAFMDESAGLMQTEWANTLFDMSGFYDGISIEKAARNNLEFGFPPLVLAMELLLHLSARILVRDKACSQPIIPVGGLVAGSKAAPWFARGLLFSALDRAHRAHLPRGVIMRSWIDDINQRLEQRRQRLIRTLKNAGHHLIRELKALGCTISTKTVVTASSIDVAKEIA